MGRNKKTKRGEENPVKGSIQQSTLISECIITNSIVSWKIFNYDELNYGVIYYKMYESHDFSCVFKLFKTHYNMYLAVRCPRINRPSVFYIPNGNLPETSSSKQILPGLYAGKFPHAFIFSKYGQFRQTGVMTVVFIMKLEKPLFSCRNKEHERFGSFLDFNYLCSAMRNMYMEGESSDFVINTEETSFKVHKHILMVRSNSFMEFFKIANHPNELTISASSIVMHLVLYYCYSGELPPLSVDCLTDVLDLASGLEILSLVERCHEDLEINNEFISDIKFMEEILERISS